MGYDSRCYDLAVVFLSDSPEKDTEANRQYLAQHIQEEIEGTIEYILKPAQCGCMRGGYPLGNCVECDAPAARDAVGGSTKP